MKTDSKTVIKRLRCLILTMVILSFTVQVRAQIDSPIPNLWHNWQPPISNVTSGITSGIKNFFTTYSVSGYHSDSTNLRFNLFILQENLKIYHDLLSGDKQDTQDTIKGHSPKGTVLQDKKSDGDSISPAHKNKPLQKRPHIWNRPGTIKVRI